jgi:sec-independent protein translocase protein TatA
MTGLAAPSHIIILGIVLLLLFGAKRLPEMGRSLGHGMREFKDSVSGEHKDDLLTPPLPVAAASDLPVALVPMTETRPLVAVSRDHDLVA